MRSKLAPVSSSFRRASFFRIRYLAIPAASSNMERRSSGRLFKISSILFWPIMDMEPRPSPVSAKRASTSFRRQFFLLIKYSLSPLRYTRRHKLTWSKSKGSSWSELSNSRVTSAMPMARRTELPAKITSSILVPRRYLMLCSPMTQRMASEILLLPLPLGPTMAVIPGSKSRLTRSAKDLNPWASNDFKRTVPFLLTPEYRTAILHLRRRFLPGSRPPFRWCW